MPRTPALKFYLPPGDKAFLYNTFKKITSIVVKDGESSLKKRQDLVKLALKFPPGTKPVYLQDWERQVIVLWLLKLHKLAETRKNVELVTRFRRIIDLLK